MAAISSRGRWVNGVYHPGWHVRWISQNPIFNACHHNSYEKDFTFWHFDPFLSIDYLELYEPWPCYHYLEKSECAIKDSIWDWQCRTININSTSATLISNPIKDMGHELAWPALMGSITLDDMSDEYHRSPSLPIECHHNSYDKDFSIWHPDLFSVYWLVWVVWAMRLFSKKWECAHVRHEHIIIFWRIGSASGSRDFTRFEPGGSTLSRFRCKTPIGKVGTSQYTFVTKKLA